MIFRGGSVAERVGAVESPGFCAPVALACLLAPLHCACSRDAPPAPDAAPPPATIASTDPPAPPAVRPHASASASVTPIATGPCPPEMVHIPAEKAFCIDRWEAILVDKQSGTRLSPYYPPSRKLAVSLYDRWQTKRLEVGNAKARAMPLPPLSDWQRNHDPVPMAVSKPGQTPNGYLSGKVARAACENAGKRLCAREEWTLGCRGVTNRPFPYGQDYVPFACNVFRTTHPSGALHDDVSRGHLDPRLNLVEDDRGPLLRATGATPTCKSEWGRDALFDMVGNLDEWIDDEDGVFVGGFFSRGKRDGCASVVKNHPTYYFDYSLGVRCCSTPDP